MPDLDKKNIPTLDDIIDDDGADDAGSSATETEDNLDLFEDKTGDSIAETEPQIDIANKEKKDDPVTDENPDKSNLKILLEPLALEQVVESVVKQMMPDLEQQLRFLIQQSLEKKLPEEIIKLADNDSNAS